MPDPPGGAPPPPQIIMQMAMGKWVSRALTEAAELDVATRLGDGERSADELAAETGAHPGALYRVLRALAAVGVFEERPQKRFANNANSSVLRADAPGSLRAMVRWLNERAAWAAWSRLDYSVRTEEPAFDKVHGQDFFSFTMEHPETAHRFHAAMTGMSANEGRAVVAAYDFSPFGRIIDVGGGHGSLMGQIVGAHPGVSGAVFDLPDVVAGIPEGAPFEALPGNFFEGVPAGGDAYVLKHIIHDWGDGLAIRLLRGCREGLRPGGKVLVLEMVVGDGPESAPAKLLDLEMLVMTPGGRERTAGEYAALFQKAGLTLDRIVPTEGPMQIIEASAA